MIRKLLLKKIIGFSIFTFLFFSVSAQSEKKFLFKNKEYKVEQSVLEYLSKKKIEENTSKLSSQLMYLNFYATKSFEMMEELPEKKKITVLDIPYLQGTNGSEAIDFQILKTTIRPSDKNQFFKFKDKFIMVYPQSTIDRNYNLFISSL